MCTIDSLQKNINQKNGVLNNRKVEKTNLKEALELLDEVPEDKHGKKSKVDASEINEMATMIEAALAKEDSKVDVVRKNGKDVRMNMDPIRKNDDATKNGKDIRMVMNPTKKNDDIMKNSKDIRMVADLTKKNDDIYNNVKNIRTIENKKDYDFKATETSRKRLSESSSLQNSLDSKKAKIQQALSTSHKSVEKKNIGVNAKPSYTHAPRSGKLLPVPAEPVIPKPVSRGPLVGGRSTIHGRKTMSIREQQEKNSKKNIAELVIRLKAENEIEKKFQKPANRSVPDNPKRKAIHPAAFGVLQSVSRLPFELNDDENSVSPVPLNSDDRKTSISPIPSEVDSGKNSVSPISSASDDGPHSSLKFEKDKTPISRVPFNSKNSKTPVSVFP